MSWRPGILLALSAGCQPWSVEPAEGRAPDARVAELAARVAAARELPLTPPKVRVVTHAEMQDVARGEYAEIPARLRARAHRQGQALGVYGATDPLEALLASAVIGGMWRTDDQRMYVVDGLPAAETEIAWPHELAHALQDQHFDLEPAAILDWPVDLQRAHALLMEGDASYVPLILAYGADVADWTPLADLGVVEPTQGRSAESRYLVGTLRHYTVGPAVVQELRRRGGWAAVDARWRAPALSSEQLLEPDRTADLPRYAPLDVADALPARWTADPADTLGQQEMYDVLWAHFPERDVAGAVRGWDGDRLQVLVADRAPAGFVWRTAWDSAADAAEFAALVGRWEPAGRAVIVEVRGDEVLVAAADGPSDALRAAAWEGAFAEVASMEALLEAHGAR